MAEIVQNEGGKKKKGAQKKMTIRVDFTPMVDMNMLLITFFMLCTTMIKSQTLQIVLPTNEKVEKENQNQASTEDAITMILDTEYNTDGTPVVDENGKTKHYIYWYAGKPEDPNTKISEEFFLGNTRNENGQKVQQGIRKILRKRNAEVMKEYDNLKEQWKEGKITKEEFDQKAKENAADENKKRPVVIIKPGPNTTYEALINALDEMSINQISRYNIQLPNGQDTVLLKAYEASSGKTVIRPIVRKGNN